MRRMRKMYILLALCLVLAMLPAASAYAADEGSLWLRQMPTNDGVTIAVCADTAVASGVITITYHSDVLTLQEVTMEDAHVLVHAVNDQKAGQVRISWIGTGAAVDGGYVLLRLRFTGEHDLSAVMTGSAYTTEGDAVPVSILNLTDITAAIMQAETLQAEDYTSDSFAAVQASLQAARELLSPETVTQAQLNTAAQQLTAAMENLEEYVPEPPPTEPTEPAPTDPAPTQPKPTQPGSEPAETDPTQPSTQAPTIAPKRDNSWMLIALGALLAVAAVAAVVILKKRGNK